MGRFVKSMLVVVEFERAASIILMHLVWRGYDSNPRPTAPDALPIDLSGPVDTSR